MFHCVFKALLIFFFNDNRLHRAILSHVFLPNANDLQTDPIDRSPTASNFPGQSEIYLFGA